jgi:membrane associated rhomboid family serine protease
MLADRAYMREPTWRRPRLSVTVVLMAISIAVFLLQLIGPSTFGWLFGHLALSCKGLERGLIYQLITYQFLHGGFLHLLFNMITLWFFGRAVEDRLGSRRYLELYFASGIIGGLLHVSLGWIFPESFGRASVVGASASICGLIAAFAALDPEQLVLFFFIPMRAKWLFYISLGIALIFVLAPNQSNIAHAAHLGGLLTGWAYIRFVLPGRWRMPGWPWFQRRPRKIVKLPRTATFLKASSSRRRALAAEDLPPAEFISREVDPILDKISAHGIQSLTERERKILEAARERMGRH